MKNKLNWLEAALLLAPFLLLILLWHRLPGRLPSHWNVQGEVDGYVSKPLQIFLLPLMSTAVVALLHALPWFDPKLRRNLEAGDRMHSVLPILRVSLAAFFAGIVGIQIAVALGYAVPTGRLVVAASLVLLAIMGNYLGNLRPNYFAGIRTPWTLESPATWRATHRLGGRLMFFGSVLLLAVQFCLSESALGLLFATLVLLLVMWAFWYSWHHSRTHGASS
jgi:uncharacterized membrane protein